MSKINVIGKLEKRSYREPDKGFITILKSDLLLSIQKIVEAVVDKCAESADSNEQAEAILQVKQMVTYDND